METMGGSQKQKCEAKLEYFGEERLGGGGGGGAYQTKSPSAVRGVDIEFVLPFLPYHCPPLCLLSPSRQHLLFLFPLQCYRPL